MPDVNIRMIDGALISINYLFKNSKILKHRLTFFPAPNLEAFQNDPNLYLHDEIYADFLDNRIVAVPIRFDFDDGDAFIPIEHPKSHLTIGQYMNCRIPVSAPLTPIHFLSFILRNFYYLANKEIVSLPKVKETFKPTLDENEKDLIHIEIPVF